MNELYSELPEGAAGLVSRDAMSILAGYADDLTEHNEDVTGHSRRVADLAVDLARAVGYEGRDLAAIWLYGRFHDIGKLYVPAEILSSSGLLSPEERKIVEKHADYGVSILSMIQGIPQDMKDVARYHHERYDGCGYNKLAGEDIPVLARIMQVADVFDAMVSKRTYKAGEPVDKALSMMTAEAPIGKFGRSGFDPHFLRVFVALQIDRYGSEMDVRILDELRDFVASGDEHDDADRMRTPSLR